MSRIGLVLGAGGVVGQAFHAGALAALEHDLGWDPRSADVIVGTSAGSVAGSLLRLGVSAGDLASAAVASPLSPEAAPLLERFGGGEPVEFPPPPPEDAFRPWRTLTPSMLARIALKPWAFKPGTALMTMLPPGRIDIAERCGPLQEISDEICGGCWPKDLWVCAVRRRDAARVVFGREGSPTVPVGLGVSASCSIPGYFAPVQIDGVSYIDGGAHSPTNADVLRREKLDLVVVLSPMSAAHGRGTGPDAYMRWTAHRQLQREILTLRAAGTKVVTFEPGPRTMDAMGTNAMANDRTDATVQASFLEAGFRASEGSVAERLQPLTSRRSRLHRVA